ncbi:MAG: phage holin family protein [Erysipelotrichaceae bacterium]|jgi:putative membrane protein|nr:phage holin family protein [Bacillota bacterium]NLP22180.1 phage holin family protein [Erysipelotrichaceae bacterium]HCY05814.1 phage holin family protein [Erysipelotrichaceae bacterium]
MKKLLAFIITNSISLFLVSSLLSGIYIKDVKTIVLLSLILGLLNATVKPILKFLSLPINILSLGLFTLIVNGFVFNLAFSLIPGAGISNFFTAVIASILFGIINGFVESILNGK